MADTDSIRKSIKKLEKKGIVIDSNGNVINMRSYKVRINKQRSFTPGAKRGRPRKKVEKTTPKRKYVRSFLHTKEAKAKAKALREAKREENVKQKQQQKLPETRLLQQKLKKEDLHQ